MAITGNTDVASAIETVVSAQVTQVLIQESVALAMPGVKDFSAEARPGMDQLDINLFTELAVQDVNENGTEMTAQTISPTAAQLLLNRHKSIPFSITSSASLESKINLVAESVRNGARSLAAEVDDATFAEGVANAGTTNTVAGADGLAEILAAKQQFDTDNVMRQGRALVASPVWMARLLGSNNIIRANEYGGAEPIRVGSVASVYGFLIFESSSASLPADGFLAMGMEAIAFARHRAMQFEQQRQVLAQRDDYTLTHKYGVESSAATNPRLYVFDPV